MHARPARMARSVRSVFVSDVHLGCRYAHADAFLKFLEQVQPDYLYLVGDIIDGWRLRKSWHWQPVYNDILRRLLQMESMGTQLRYAPGNHDEFLRHFLADFGVVQVADEFVHVTADGRRLLILHGDRFDNCEQRARWLSVLGASAYDWLIWANGQVNRVRRWCGWGDWRFSACVKGRVKGAVKFVSDFERRVAAHAREQGCAGIVCGHIHTPSLALLDGVQYANTGDWVEHCSALLEYGDGTLELVSAAPWDANPWRPDTTDPKPAAAEAAARPPRTEDDDRLPVAAR